MIAQSLRRLRAQRIAVIIDACQSGSAIELSQIARVKVQALQRQTAVSAANDGVGVHLIAATLPLSYAVGLKNGASVLATTPLAALRGGSGVMTIDQLTAFVGRRLPVTSSSVTGFRQVSVLNSIGLDFPIASR